MEAYGYRWYRVGGLDYLLKRSDMARRVVILPDETAARAWIARRRRELTA